MKPKILFIQTYGCTANKADSQIMENLLKQSGFKITYNENEANYFLINTCAVKHATEEKIIYRLKELSKFNKPIIISGCLTEINPKRIKEILPNFSGMLNPKSISKIVEIFTKIESGNKNVIKLSKVQNKKFLTTGLQLDKSIKIIKISEGCLSNCSYCGTKLARGNLISYTIRDIKKEFEKSLKQNYKTFYLTSQDNSGYGIDTGTNLPNLLNKIISIKGDFKIRVGMMNPKQVLNFLDDLIKVYKDNKIQKFLHIPVQSGSDKVLKEMNRNYKVENFIKIVNKFRKEIPSINIATDIIVGYPSENEEDFKKSIELIKKIKPEVLNISKFGARPGTQAAKLKPLKSQIVKERSVILTKVFKQIINQKFYK